jgi:DNA repair protein RecO (recombination protein O)
MLHKTRGIVFSSHDFGESSVVAKIYTELYGIQSYLVNSVRKKNPRFHHSLFQPLTPLDLVVYHKERPGLQRVSEIRPNPPLESIPFDVYKSSLAFFLDEVLLKSIREEESNPQLFDFILSSVIELDKESSSENNFHLFFLLKLSKYLGFGPTNNFNTTTTIFDLKEGRFTDKFPDHPHFVQMPQSETFSRLMSNDTAVSAKINTADRRALISFLLEYYSLHIEGFGNIKSQRVLEQIWGE